MGLASDVTPSNPFGWRSFVNRDRFSQDEAQLWVDGSRTNVIQTSTYINGLNGAGKPYMTVRDTDPHPNFTTDNFTSPEAGGRNPNEDVAFELDSIWRQCHIQFRLNQYRVFHAPDACRALRATCPGSSATWQCANIPNYSTGQASLSSLVARSGEATVVIVDSLVQPGGYACASNGVIIEGWAAGTFDAIATNFRGGGFAVIASDQMGVDSKNLIAHEVAHMFGNSFFGDGAYPGTNNLQSSPMSALNPTLTPAQCAEARMQITTFPWRRY